MTWYALAMFIGDKSELEKLNFEPRGHHFKMARIEWKNVVLNPKGGESYPVVDLSDWKLVDLLFDLFGPLSLIEIFELFKACLEQPPLAEALEPQAFMLLQKRQWNQRLQDLFSKLQETPQCFLNWAHNKQLGHRELQPLLSLNNLEVISPLLQQFPRQGLSRNDGKVVLDLLVDLVLMKKTETELEPKENQNWLETLKSLRNPMSRGIRPKSVKEGWPKYVQVVNFRQGDRVLQKMQITFLDQDDLHGKLQRLSLRETQK